MQTTTLIPEEIHLVNQTQAAEVLAVNPRTLEGWRCKGGGPPFIRVGRRVRYRMSDLRDWIEERTFGSTTEADSGRGA